MIDICERELHFTTEMHVAKIKKKEVLIYEG